MNPRLKPIVTAILALATLAASLSSATATSGRSAPADPVLDASGVGCSWLAHSDPDTVNVAYPDTSATYWLTSFTLAAGQTLRITGTYPRARYFSFHSYTDTGFVEDSAYDAQLKASTGSGNPFRHRVAAGRGKQYALTVRVGRPPAHRPANTVYTGTVPEVGADTVTGLLIYRVYTPTRAASLAGGVPLPAIALRGGDGTTLAQLGPCATSQPTTAGAVNAVYNTLGYPASGPAIPVPNATKTPTWQRATSNLKVAGLFSNQQNAYLTARTSLQYGEVLVIHAKAPSFPDTAAGTPAYRATQVRYWSMCQNSVSTRVLACVPDAAAPRRHGSYTVVVSPAASRPATADRRHGVAWIPWGPQPDGLLIYRNMVAAPGFAGAAQRVSDVATPARMGAYYPSAHYCSTASYEAKGPLRCTT